MKTHWFSIALLLPLLLACSSAEDGIDKRVEYWSDRLSQKIPAGSLVSEAIEVAVELDEKYHFSKEDQILVIFLEELEGDGLVCARWRLHAEIPVAGGLTGQPKIQKYGMCL